ncbi:MAG: hypothetical protein HQK99_10590 [Nitrospirae bacterium]|nr:hypothetical protein [Nitrospirota bacterium]
MLKNHPEPVEGLPIYGEMIKKGASFDKLRMIRLFQDDSIVSGQFDCFRTIRLFQDNSSLLISMNAFRYNWMFWHV